MEFADGGLRITLEISSRILRMSFTQKSTMVEFIKRNNKNIFNDILTNNIFEKGVIFMFKYKTAHIATSFMKENQFFMGKLTNQQQKIWFVPFLGINPNSDDYYTGELIKVPVEDVRSFIGSTKNDRDLNRTFTKAFETFESLYVNKEKKPFSFLTVKKGYVCFQFEDIFQIMGFRNGHYHTINLEEIASYKNGKNQKSRTIPLLWYCLPHRHYNKSLSCWEVDFGDLQLKKVLGLNRWDYMYIPKEYKEFYIETTKYIWTEGNKLYRSYDYMEYICQKYNYRSIDIAANECNRLESTMYFRRWDFEQKVLLPAIEELNQGTMIKFRLQEVLKRAPKGERAQKVKSYIGKNYELQSDDIDILMPNGEVKSSKPKNFRKLKAGNQYHLLIEA